MDVSAPPSFYRWAAFAISLVVLKFAVEKALSIRTAFRSIKYVRSTYTVVSTHAG